jgi:ABC-type oligopeptide transport system substrate-binding subunit
MSTYADEIRHMALKDPLVRDAIANIADLEGDGKNSWGRYIDSELSTAIKDKTANNHAIANYILVAASRHPDKVSKELKTILEGDLPPAQVDKLWKEAMSHPPGKNSAAFEELTRAMERSLSVAIVAPRHTVDNQRRAALESQVASVLDSPAGADLRGQMAESMKHIHVVQRPITEVTLRDVERMRQGGRIIK